MPKMRTEVKDLEAQVQNGNKRFVRYAEGAALYSLGLHTFQEIAKEANAVYKVKRCVIVNLDIVYEYLYGNIERSRQLQEEAQEVIRELFNDVNYDLQGFSGKEIIKSKPA